MTDEYLYCTVRYKSKENKYIMDYDDIVYDHETTDLNDLIQERMYDEYRGK